MSYLMNTALRHLYGNIRRSSMGITKNCDKCMNATSFHLIRSINTSEKKKDATQSITSYVPGLMDKPPKGPQTVKEFADVGEQKNWTNYGFDIGNMREDRYVMNLAFFSMVTVVMVICTWILAYYPDYKLTDWSVREAFLQVHRREKLGLPVIDKNLVDPSLIELPSDEELGDTEIII